MSLSPNHRISLQKLARGWSVGTVAWARLPLLRLISSTQAIQATSSTWSRAPLTQRGTHKTLTSSWTSARTSIQALGRVRRLGSTHRRLRNLTLSPWISQPSATHIRFSRTRCKRLQAWKNKKWSLTVSSRNKATIRVRNTCAVQQLLDFRAVIWLWLTTYRQMQKCPSITSNTV